MTNVDITKPVIWTKRGNVNEDDVVKFSEWERHGETIVHIIGCRDKVTGEELKRGVYVLHPPLDAGGVNGSFR